LYRRRVRNRHQYLANKQAFEELQFVQLCRARGLIKDQVASVIEPIKKPSVVDQIEYSPIVQQTQQVDDDPSSDSDASTITVDEF
jgi:hypothetical protein